MEIELVGLLMILAAGMLAMATVME